MKNRICGREQEFGMAILPKDKGVHLKLDLREEVVSQIIQIISEMLPAIKDASVGSSGVTDSWLSNGLRIYEDDRLLEVATAECRAGTYELIAQERAVEIILNRAIKRLNKIKKFKRLEIIFYRNNVGFSSPSNYSDEGCSSPDMRGCPSFYPDGVESDRPKEDSGPSSKGKKDFLLAEVTYGSHHNYSYHGRKKKEIFKALKNFLPVSVPLWGSGHILRFPNGECVYGFSQRARHVDNICGENTNGFTIGRPLINTRNEPRMKRHTGLKRLHLISRDATRCEFQTWLVDGITHLVLRLAEERWRLPRRLFLKNPIKTLQELNQRTDLNYKVGTKSGAIDAVEYNKIFLRAAKKLKKLSNAERKIIYEWSRVLQLLKARKWQKLVGELDWATKLFLLKSKMKRHGFGLESLRAWKICLDYHNISSSPRRSWFARLDKSGYIRHLISKKVVKRAIFEPPETRAKARGQFIKFYVRRPKLKGALGPMDWEFVSLNGVDDIIFGKNGNPFSTESLELERLLKNPKTFRKDFYA